MSLTQCPQKISIGIEEIISIKESGFYSIIITARCNKKTDLRFTVDGRFFREIPPAKNVQKYNIPAAWNGDHLKGLRQTNVFILHLIAGEHKLQLIPKGEVTIVNFELQPVNDSSQATFTLKNQSEKRNWQSWINFILIDLPISSLSAEISTNWHLWDGDDVKLLVDGKDVTNFDFDNNPQANFLWHATPTQLFGQTKTEQKNLAFNLSPGIHYLEFLADQTPTINQVRLNLTTNHYLGQRFGTKDGHRYVEFDIDETDWNRADWAISPAFIFWEELQEWEIPANRDGKLQVGFPSKVEGKFYPPGYKASDFIATPITKL